MRSNVRSGVEPVGSAAGDAVALVKENVKLGEEALMVELTDADTLELLAVPVEEDGVAEITGTGARVAAVAAEQSVAETVTVETRVTVTKPSVPMTTVGVTILPEEELVLVAGVMTGVEAEAEEVTVTVDDVPTLVEEVVGVAELLGVLRVRI